MAREKVVIEVEARFIDNMSPGVDKAKKKAEGLGKKKWKAIFDADTNPFFSKFNKIAEKANKFSGKGFKSKIEAMDEASKKIEKAFDMGKKFGKSIFRGTLKVLDAATAPIRKIMNSLMSLKTLFLGVVSAMATKKLIIDPINLADQYSSAKIGFSTLLGDTAGQQMMDKIDKFAKETPFKTSGVISNVQKMMAYGWDVDRVIEDMKTIGDAAAATGKGDQGLESIVYALSEIRSKGKLSTQELNQLASAGIKAKAYLAEGLGYGTSDEGMAKLAKDLESGAIGANQAIELILQGMKEFNGMMDRTANETVEGLKSQLEDTFEINVARRWGQGLQDGAKRGLGAVVELLDKADGSLSKFGDLLYDIGSNVSGWVAERFENAVERITNIVDTFEFDQASIPEKIGMLFKGVIADPLSEWWNTSGRDLAAEKAADFGKWLGEGITEGVEMLSNGILYMLGLTPEKAGGEGKGIGASFWDSFTDAFDAGRVTNAIVSAISGVWSALPPWAKILLGTYGAGKVMGGLANFAGGIANFVGGVGSFIGSTGNAIVNGSGILGKLASVGYLANGGGGAGAYFGAGMSGATAALAGGATIAGGLFAGYGALDTIGQYVNAFKKGNITKRGSEGNISMFKAGAQTVGMGLGAWGGAKAGAAIGTMFGGPIGTVAGGLIGAGVGWVGGKLLGNHYEKVAREAEAAKYSTEAMKDAVKNTEISSEELAATWEKAVWERQREIFGDIELSAAEISTLSKQIVLGDNVAAMDEFASATSQAENSLSSLKNSVSALDKWNWKAGLGVKLTDDDQKSYKAAVDDFINSAQNYLESKHYEFTASVGILMDTENGSMGAQIIKDNNAFYAGLEKQVDDYSKQLSDLMSKALENGRLDDMIDIEIGGEKFHISEQEAIEKLQGQITNIINKINSAREKAQLDMIEIKFKNSGISYESYEELQSGIDSYIETALGNLDEAQMNVLANLYVQLDEAKTQEEKDRIQAEIDATLESYGIKVDELKANVDKFTLDLSTDTFSAEDVLGKDAAQKISYLLSGALKEGIKPGNLTGEDVKRILGLENLDEEAAEVIAGVLNNLNSFEYEAEIDANGNVVWKMKTDDDPTEQIKSTLPESVQETVEVDIFGQKEVQNFIDVLVSDFGIPEEQAATIALLLTGDKQILSKIDTSALAKELGVPEDVLKTVIAKISGEKDITKKVDILADELAPQSEVFKTIKVNITAIKGKVTSFLGNLFGSANGGIYGFANGGIVGGFADGGYTHKKMLSWIGEEGPEAIIPLTPARRARALDLWEETGKRLGVLKNANGGVYAGGDGPSSGSSVQVNVGGVTIEVKSEGGNVLETIKAQKEQIATEVAEVLNVALSAQFNNMPAKA